MIYSSIGDVNDINDICDVDHEQFKPPDTPPQVWLGVITTLVVTLMFLISMIVVKLIKTNLNTSYDHTHYVIGVIHEQFTPQDTPPKSGWV